MLISAVVLPTVCAVSALTLIGNSFFLFCFYFVCGLVYDVFMMFISVVKYEQCIGPRDINNVHIIISLQCWLLSHSQDSSLYFLPTIHIQLHIRKMFQLKATRPCYSLL